MKNNLYNSITTTVAVIVMCFSAPSLIGQCTFNCNDTINVSVDFNCMADITFDLILEGADFAVGCEYAVLLTNEAGVTISGAQVGKPEVGMLLKAKVFQNGNPNGPSCWGYVKIEDKLPPPIECAGNDTLMCQLTDPYFTDSLAEVTLKDRIDEVIAQDPLLVDNCGDGNFTVTITDNVLDRTYCTDGFSAISIVSYNVFDNDRIVLPCTDTILYEQLPLDTIDSPKNYSGDMALDCNDPYPTIEYLISIDREVLDENSLPNFQGSNLFDYVDSSFIERGLCNLKTTYEDLEFPTCGSTFKIVRRWIILDWCNGENRDFHQIIKVQDTDISIGSCPDYLDNTADTETCTALVEIVPPTVADDECSDWTFLMEVRDPEATEFVAFGGQRVMDTNVIRRDFLLGISDVRYTVTDACGNIDSCRFIVEVLDKDAPTAICDARTVVTLNDSFLGKANAKSFDDGSYDGCSGIASYKVRRVDFETTTCPIATDSSEFSDFVKFCCADIGKTILVEMQVTDSVGLTASCVAEAVIQFKGAGPVITCAPDIISQDCRTHDSFDITTLEAPTITSSNPCIADNLTPSLREVARDLDNCGDGFIDVEWFINITGVEEIICSQRIIFENTNPFSESLISWPTDRTVNTCGDVPATQQELENLIPDTLSCANILPSEPEDRVFENVVGACRRIVRTWTVVDWCRYPADLSARYTFEQTITVINTTGPVIDAVASSVDVVMDNDNCRGIVSAIGIASDDCSELGSVTWTHEVVSGNTVIVPLTSGNTLNVVLSLGDYQLRWIATDDCGNATEATQDFTIRDVQAPTMRCASIQLRIDAVTKDVIININDVDDGSFDNCDAVIDLRMRRAGTTDSLSAILIFDCQEQGVTQIEIVGTDDAGNSASCIAAVDIRDFEDNCALGSSAFEVSGHIYTPEGTAVEDVAVNLSPMIQDESDQVDITNVDGAYVFDNVAENKMYQMSAAKLDDYRNGISTLDIILMQQHILGLRSLDAPYKMLAADVNGNKAISATDIVLLRRLLLGSIDVFPGQPAWKFVDKDAISDDINNPWDMPSHVEFEVSDQNKGLVAIKMGDLDYNAIANSAVAKGRSVKSYALLTDTRVSNHSVSIDIKASSDIYTLGFQLGIDFDPYVMSFKGMTSNSIDISEEYFSVVDGQVRIVWSQNHDMLLSEGDEIITLQFDKLHDNVNYQVNIAQSLSNEIVDNNLNVNHLHLVQATKKTSEIKLSQNRPNPFSDITIIEFELPTAQHIDFIIYDINGSKVFNVSETFVEGLNQLRISKEGLGLNKGIYYYEINSHDRSLINKMILL